MSIQIDSMNIFRQSTTKVWIQLLIFKQNLYGHLAGVENGNEKCKEAVEWL